MAHQIIFITSSKGEELLNVVTVAPEDANFTWLVGWLVHAIGWYWFQPIGWKQLVSTYNWLVLVRVNWLEARKITFEKHVTEQLKYTKTKQNQTKYCKKNIG